jgi:hypothetical protein
MEKKETRRRKLEKAKQLGLLERSRAQLTRFGVTPCRESQPSHENWPIYGAIEQGKTVSRGVNGTDNFHSESASIF